MRWKNIATAIAIAFFLSNICAKYYKNLSMLSRVIAKNVGDVFFETQCIAVLAADGHRPGAACYVF